MVFNDLNRNEGMTMSAHCHDCQAHDDHHRLPAPGYRRVLWIALLINVVMFGVEIVAGLSSGSVSVLGKALWSMSQGVPPEPLTMGLIGALALAANLGAAALLYAFRDGDSNMRG